MATLKRYESFEELKQSEVVQSGTKLDKKNQKSFEQFGKMLHEALLKATASSKTKWKNQPPQS